MAKQRRSFPIIVSLSAIIVFAIQGKAQTTISYGQTIVDSITMLAQNKTYQLSATANDLVRFELTQPVTYYNTYPFAPYITIYNQNGSIFLKTTAAQPTVLLDTLRFPATGTYTILIADASGHYTGKFTLSIFGIIVALQPPTLVSPSNGSLGISITPTFSWNLISGATTYRLQVSSLSDFSSTAFDDSTIIGGSRTLSSPLVPNITYYWRVNAANAGGTSPWASPWSFKTTMPGPLTYRHNPAVYIVGSAIIPDTLVNAGGPVDSFTVTPALPAGLVLSKATGVISGTPTTVTAKHVYQVTGYNATASAFVYDTITVNPSTAVIPKSFMVKSFSLSGSSGLLRYALPVQCHVSIKYYDYKGRLVGSFVNTLQNAGSYSLPLPVSAWARGSYIQDFEAGKFVKKERIIIVN